MSNQQESGNINFQQSYHPATNRINGYSYDVAGDLLGDGMNTYTYDGEGMLASTNGAQYVYDALQQRVEKTGGSNPTEVIYFNGKPIALLNASSGAWTDLIWVGDNILAEVPGNQTATPVYRLLDHEGSLVATTDNSGNVTGSNLIAPYGQLMASNTSDPYLYDGLYQDTEYGGDDAWYRNYSAEQSRWLRPDPYNGSYDLNNPQSFNRYMYVNGNPLGSVDPSGLADGIVNGIGGSVCKGYGYAFNGGITPTIGGVNPCNPVESIVSLWIDSAFNIDPATQAGQAAAAGIAAAVAAAVTIACSIDYNKTACGPKGWASDVIGGTAGKVVGDSFAVAGAVACIVLGPDACIGYAIYTIANDVFAAVWDALGLGPPTFTGSLLPRPTDLGGLGTAPIGIPNQNLSLNGILGRPSRGTVLSPGMGRP